MPIAIESKWALRFRVFAGSNVFFLKSYSIFCILLDVSLGTYPPNTVAATVFRGRPPVARAPEPKDPFQPNHTAKP